MLDDARVCFDSLMGYCIDTVQITPPKSVSSAKSVVAVASKLSHFYASSMEQRAMEELNRHEWGTEGKWVRQDPGFPDIVFDSEETGIKPGIEIKAWYPLSTEITARFKESQTLFSASNVDVLVIAWVPDHIVWGKAEIIDLFVCSARSVAEARDAHYHNPPDYLVFEPENTESRTKNLMQTNTNGYKLQDRKETAEAGKVVDSWGDGGKEYSPSPEYQSKLKALRGAFGYRLDTNYAKMDRIQHEGLEEFKKRVMDKSRAGKTIGEWSTILKSLHSEVAETELARLLDM